MLRRKLFSILAGRSAAELLEHTVELRQRLKTDFERDLADRSISVTQTFAGSVKTQAGHVLHKIRAGNLLEFFAEMAGADVRRPCRAAQRHLIGIIFVYE